MMLLVRVVFGKTFWELMSMSTCLWRQLSWPKVSNEGLHGSGKPCLSPNYYPIYVFSCVFVGALLGPNPLDWGIRIIRNKVDLKLKKDKLHQIMAWSCQFSFYFKDQIRNINKISQVNYIIHFPFKFLKSWEKESF